MWINLCFGCVSILYSRKFNRSKNILEIVAPCLFNSNSDVVLSCIKITMKYLDFLSSPDLMRSYSKKLARHLITLMVSDPEI
jgi:hypothetical protein